MPILLTAKDITKAFDSRPLFRDLNFVIESGERIGLIGPNGAGKSTLLKIISSQITADEGDLVFQGGTRVGFLEQTPVFKPGKNILETLLEGAREPDEWEAYAKAEELIWKLEIEKAGLKAEALVESLSGGWKKRLAVARELMREPDLLLMDEPTNHLDVESIFWLEDLVNNSRFATLTITHDRLFLQKVSNRIIELDRRHVGGLLSVKGDYSTYLELRESLMSAQEKQEAILRGNLRRETEWLRQGAKARTTKQQARIKRHGELSAEVGELALRNTKREMQMEFVSAEKNPKRLIEATKISKKYGNRPPLFTDLDLMFTPKTRLGILGSNGCGKSTLIRILMGLEKPDSGNVFRSDQLKICYFEQNRETLDPNLTLHETVCPHGDSVHYRGVQIHIRSYLDRFAFAQNQTDMKVGRLSGGEQSRVLLAKLMLIEANFLILDEPTNDLDIATLNLLQECLTQFDGAVLLVSHDRYFLDQVSNKLLAFPITATDKRRGKLHFFADLEQWESWRENELAKDDDAVTVAANSAPEAAKKPTNKKELDALTKKIEKAESNQKKLIAECELPENASDLPRLTKLGQKMNVIQSELDDLYKQWGMLDTE